MENKLATTTEQLLMQPNLQEYLVKQLAGLYVFAGFTSPSAPEFVLLSDLVMNEINNYFPSLTVKEFELALNKGIRGDFGQYMGISVLSVSKWIRAFKSAYKAPVIAPVSELPSEQEKLDAKIAWRAKMTEQFLLYKETNRIDIAFPNFQYRGFVDNGLLQEKDYMNYLESATRHVIEKAKSKRITADNYNRNKLSEMIRRIEDGKANKQDTGAIVQQAQIDCIKSLYDSLKELKFKDTFEHVIQQ